MAVAHGNTSAGITGTGTTATMNKPTGSTGDLCLGYISYKTNAGQQTITPSESGWTAVGHVYSAPLVHGLAVYWRLIAGGDPSTYTFGLSGGGTVDWLTDASVYTGGNSSSPISGTVQSNNSITAGTLLASPSYTPGENNCMILAVFGFSSNGDKRPASPDGSPAATERVDEVGNGNAHLYVEEFLQGTAAAVSLEVTYNSSTLDAARAFTFGIAPATATTVSPQSLYTAG